MTAPLDSGELDRIEALYEAANEIDPWSDEISAFMRRVPALIAGARDGLRWREYITVAMRNDPNWRQNMMPLDATAPGDASSGEGGDVQPDSD